MPIDPISRRAALTLGTLAGTLAASGLAEASPDPQLSSSSDVTPVNNGPAAPDTIPAGGELHRNAGGDYASMTTNQGLPVADDENSLKSALVGQYCSKTSFFARKSTTSTTSGFRSASFMLGAWERTAILN